MPFSLFSLLFLATTLPPSSSITTHSRRSLHEPLFPLSTPPPPLPLPPPPPISPSIPKFPSSSTPTDPSTPFFPLDPSTPPPPTTASLPTFPANISSLSFPHSPSTPHHSAATKLLPTIVLPLLALSLLSIVITFFLLRRRRRNHTNSADKKPPSAAGKRATASEFLYLGTLVNSCRRADDDPITAAAAVSPYYKLSSPELRPLPPLTRQNYANAACSSDEEFYSPRGSSAEKESPAELLAGHLSSSRTTFPTTTQNGGSPSSTLSTPSYPSSNSASSPPIGSSPARSTIKSVCSSRSSTGRASEIRLSVSTSPPPPPPPPLTPSPPKPKSPFPSSGSRISTQRIPQNPQAAPPPPPPPPAGYWESRVRRPQASQPADLATPVSVELKNFTTGGASGNSDSGETTRPKLKPLHWDKVRASSDRATVWDQLKSSSFQVNEEMIESLFVCNPSNAMPKESDKRQVLTPGKQEDRVLDPKKSHNIAILLRALNVTKEEVCEALMDGNTDSLGAELLETLVKMAPSKEEEVKLKEHKDDSPVKLGPAEKFLKAVLDVPFAFKRVDAMLYIANFDSEVKYLKNSFETLEAACEELRSSRLFLKLLEAVLKSGNRMNIGTNRGDAHAFKLDTLLKLVDIKGADGKTTLLHFVVQEMIRTEGSRLSKVNQSVSKTEPGTPQDDLKYKKLGLQAVAGLKDELGNVKKAAAMDSDVLSSYVSKLAGGIGKVSEVMRLDERQGSKESGRRFHESMSGFLKKAENGIIKIQAQESVALSLVKEITEYFHGNSTKEEAHPFRIFMVVRDFMSILDQVCKEVGRVSPPSYVSSARQLPVPVNPTLLPLFPRLNALRAGSSDDESSSSS